MSADNFLIKTSSNHRVIQEAIKRYTKLLFNPKESPGLIAPRKFDGSIVYLSLHIKDEEQSSTHSNEKEEEEKESSFSSSYADLTLETDESYELLIVDKQAVLSAHSVFGILRGLETFSQLAYYDRLGQKCVEERTINDFPRFKYRGFLLDTARHYLSPTVLKQHLDAMAYAKMNVFHWHIVDDQSFPFVSQAYPLLSEKGAFSRKHVYTKEMVKDIVEYAYLRGIRVIPEFDTPGHILSWGKGYPQLLTKSDDVFVMDSLTCPINPTEPFTYELVAGLWREVAEVFPDHMIHIGGDEVPLDCWSRFENATTATTRSTLFFDYERHVLNIASELNKTPIVWEEVVLKYGLEAPPGTIVALWKSHWETKIPKLAEGGLPVIVVSPWYLNYINYGASWEKYYRELNTELDPIIIGGEGAMWGEFVDNSNVIARVWSFAAAIAERLWTPPAFVDLEDTRNRIQNFHCLLVARGINAQPPNGPSFCPYEIETIYQHPF